jgi:hypothetical protein
VLRARLTALDAAARRAAGPTPTARDLRRTVRAKTDDWLRLFERHPAEARQTVLRPLLASRIIMSPIVTPSARTYTFTAPLSWGGIVSGLLGAAGGDVMLVVPPG